MIQIHWLDAGPQEPFPPADQALQEPDGLLAAGGDLSPARLLDGYGRGIFPWYSAGQPILWWSPSRRTVFDTAGMHVARRLARWLKNCPWSIKADTAFAQVMHACAAPRKGEHGTWINDDMVEAYCRLHQMGHAHSVEAWDGERLVGGIYGIARGRMFFGESMFSAVTNGSKVALLSLCHGLNKWGFPLLDAQMASDHLFTLGAKEMSRSAFCSRVADLAKARGVDGSWCESFPVTSVADLAR